MATVGTDEHVDQTERTTPHRAHVGDVCHHRGGTRRVRVGAHERRRDRLAAHDQVLARVRNRGAVVAVDRKPETMHER
jgi:hypothetical protein